MLKKFIKITGTGKFLDYTHSTVPTPYRPADFKRINLLYGENGSGKTTLSLILKSLKEDDSLLQKKRSFDQSYPQAIEVLTDAATPVYRYNGNVWNAHYQNIEIFDTHFINENIYTGLEIQPNHRKNLFEIIFGQPGVQLKSEIETIKTLIQGVQADIRTVSEKIEANISNAFTASDYCSHPIDLDIQNKIRAKESEIAVARNFREIQSKSNLQEIPLLALPYVKEDVKAVLEKSIENISVQYLEKVREHKSHLPMNGNEESWLKAGLEAIRDNACPFCLRPFDSHVEIIEAYNQYFNEEYNKLVRNLNAINSAVQTFNLEASIYSIETKIAGNQSLITFWEGHVPNPPTNNSILDQRSELVMSLEKVKESLKQKSLNPIKASGGSALEEFQTLVVTFNTNLTKINGDIRRYNDQINNLKSSRHLTIPELEADLKRLRAIEKRADPSISILCTELSTKRIDLDNLNSDKTNKQGALDTYSIGVFHGYSLKINQYLNAFAPYLEIRDFTSSYVGQSTTPIVNYALHINGNEIKQDGATNHPTFKYSLSEGDKSALALAFFLAKLESDPSISDKTIVFDDPVSSFDLNRKSTTISKLINVSQRAKQLFVFTHNIYFAGEFWKRAAQLSIPSQCSKIEFLGNTSCVVEFNIDTETLSSILKDSLAIKSYLSTGTTSDEDRRAIARCLRPALESYFHLKFFDVVTANDWLGNFIDKVRNATPADPFFRLQPNLSELQEINDYSKKYHHRFNTSNDTEPITDAELRSYCDRTLKLIQVI